MRGGRFKRAAGSLVALATLVVISSAQTESSGFYGHICNTTAECKFQGALCDEALKVCQCQPEVPISNQHDKCGKAASFNDVCTFDEQCKELDYQTECKNGRCACIVESEQRISADGSIVCDSMNGRHGDQCSTAADCHFKYSVCTEIQKTCQCHPDMPITNYHDKCGKPASINESCSFNEQCEAAAYKTECRNERCSCKFEMVPKITADGGIVCTQVKADEGPHRTLDPAMIGVLVGMALMFVIICVVLRLFSKARWRENRTIFNTPNPRLMNVSLLRDSKHSQDKDRRGSRVSVRPPSRQASQQELRPHSPSPARPHQSHQLHRKPSGSRRGSRASSGHSATSLRSATIRSPTTPGPASVTVEIRAPDA